MQVSRESIKNTIIVCFIMLFLPKTGYSVMLPLSTEELKTNADVVLRGNVEEVKSLWSNDHMVIVTHVEIGVNYVYKGKLNEALVTSREIVPGELSKDFITIEFDGGKVDDIEFSVSDMPKFTEGTEVIVFLKIKKSRIKNNVYKLVGLAQGKYIIDDDGVVKKEGFTTIASGKEDEPSLIDNNIPVEELVEKIDENRGAFIYIDRGK
jgi:hypothetical protein